MLKDLYSRLPLLLSYSPVNLLFLFEELIELIKFCFDALYICDKWV